MNKTICPICHHILSQVLRPDFLLCPDCQVAVRVSGTLAKESDRLNVYSEKWVEEHSNNPIAKDIANHTAQVVSNVLSNESKVLDIGCGSGLLVDKLSAMGYQSYGLDWSEPAVNYASRNMRGLFLLSRAEIVDHHGMAPFGCIVASHLLEHLENPHEFLESVKGLLEPDGYLVIAVPNLDWWNLKSVYRSVSTIFDPEHVVGYSPKGLRKLLETNGYQVVCVLTRTHRLAILTALGITAYHRISQTRISWNGNITTRSDVPVPSTRTAQRTYSRITDNPIVARVLSMTMRPFNRMSEKGLRGMELIAVARKEN